MSRPVGFYKDKKGTTRPVTKPITRAKARKTRVVKKVVPAPAPAKPVSKDIKFEWYDDVWLDFYGEFEGSKGEVKAQRGLNIPRDFYMAPPKDSPERNRLFIEEIWVEPEGQGYGTMLMRALEQEARSKGIVTLGAEVTEDTVPFFEKMGWEPSTDPPTWEETNWGRARLPVLRDGGRGRRDVHRGHRHPMGDDEAGEAGGDRIPNP